MHHVLCIPHTVPCTTYFTIYHVPRTLPCTMYCTMYYVLYHVLCTVPCVMYCTMYQIHTMYHVPHTYVCTTYHDLCYLHRQLKIEDAYILKSLQKTHSVTPHYVLHPSHVSLCMHCIVCVVEVGRNYMCCLHVTS